MTEPSAPAPPDPPAGGTRAAQGTASRDDRVAWGSPEGRAPLAGVACGHHGDRPPGRPADPGDPGAGPPLAPPALEGVLLVVLIVANPVRVNRESSLLRGTSIALIAIITAANFVALGELIRALLEHTNAGGRSLVFASVPIWLTNVIVFGLWYWELDRGGVAARLHPTHRRPDFLFPQMSTPGSAPGWTPDFLDYLYTSFTNATAFSPTDTMPLTAWSKLLMMLQSLASLLTVAIVISRAVNILN